MTDSDHIHIAMAHFILAVLLRNCVYQSPADLEMTFFFQNLCGSKLR